MSSATRTWKMVKPHIPLIRFRKGGRPIQEYVSEQSPSKTKSVVLDEFELPAKYARKPLSHQEMEFIERGGPE
ncbi:alpha-ketoglutarate dehydrogenase component 4 [Centruroides vittatus]|uniref:alpha-ketoglutarate dehydrogenase component 4 n=1 Tax=Centruroides vittatus TaxID=120091 RepID=UPI00350F6AA7